MRVWITGTERLWRQLARPDRGGQTDRRADGHRGMRWARGGPNWPLFASLHLSDSYGDNSGTIEAQWVPRMESTVL